MKKGLVLLKVWFHCMTRIFKLKEGHKMCSFCVNQNFWGCDDHYDFCECGYQMPKFLEELYDTKAK